MKVSYFLNALAQIRTAIESGGEIAGAESARELFPELTWTESRALIRQNFARELASFRAAQIGPIVHAVYAKNA